MTIAPFPLAWPPGLPRTPGREREKGGFKATLSSALGNVQTSLRLFAKDSGQEVAEISLSSNVSLGVNAPADPGVAVWFLWDGEQRCIAVDRYTTPAANLQAIHHVIEARRVEARHGTLHMVRAAFSGLRALPPPSGPHWTVVLQVPETASTTMIEHAFKRLARERHPDQPGGSADAMAELNAARAAALQERG